MARKTNKQKAQELIAEADRLEMKQRPPKNKRRGQKIPYAKWMRRLNLPPDTLMHGTTEGLLKMH